MIDRARQLREIIESLVEKLDDETALKSVELFPNWEVNNPYIIGDKVRYNGILYKCLIAHTSQSDWIPKDAVSLWTRVLIPDPETIPEWEQTESTNPYMKGDKVKHNGTTWISTIDNNVWQPGVYGWEKINS